MSDTEAARQAVFASLRLDEARNGALQALAAEQGTTRSELLRRGADAVLAAYRTTAPARNGGDGHQAVKAARQ